MNDSYAVPILSLDYDDAAKATSLSRGTLERLVAANEIPHARIRGRVMFPVKELTKWLSELAAEQRGDLRMRKQSTDGRGRA